MVFDISVAMTWILFLALFPMAALPATWIFAVLGFFAGLSWGPFNPLWNTVVQTRVQPELQGRVYGLQMSLLYAGPPVGQLIIGACVVLGALTAWLAFAVLLPVLGHATWHGYRETIDASAWPVAREIGSNEPME